MSLGLLEPRAEASPSRLGPRWVAIHRRGPILRPSPAAEGVYGIDLTAGCALGCAFCHVRGAPWYPGEGRVLFDPEVSRRLVDALDAMEGPPRRVVLSPTSDPLPPHRGVRAEAGRVARMLLERGIEVVLMTRGRIPRTLIALLARHASLVRVAVALTTLDRGLCRSFEPLAAAPAVRLRGLRRLVEAGVSVEARLEPLIPGLTDGAENVRPLLAALASAGVRRVVAHDLFLHPSMRECLDEAVRPFGLVEKLADDYSGGPVFAVGTLGPTRHLPLEVRKASLARLVAWGAEHGLEVQTGSAQNPDFRRVEPAPTEAAPSPLSAGRPRARARGR